MASSSGQFSPDRSHGLQLFEIKKAAPVPYCPASGKFKRKTQKSRRLTLFQDAATVAPFARHWTILQCWLLLSALNKTPHAASVL